ncbi:MAG: fibronectin type III domain-containing protein, partial [Chloroflexi bacterium]|nr:fibronectin type III domain-containing protein [Chloroflexota bacterium]
MGILLQRSADGGPCEDVTVLPTGTAIYTDTDVLEDASYAYRVQALDSAGNDSDCTTTAVSGRSLPALPQPPTLHSVTAVAADALALQWSSPAGDVVTSYRLERSGSAGGRFDVVLQTGGGITLTHDTGLAPGATYYYRVAALNDTGASTPSAV